MLYLEKGLFVYVYQKPLTFEDFEGSALLVKYVSNHHCFDGFVFETWIVEFADGFRCERLVSPANLVPPLKK